MTRALVVAASVLLSSLIVVPLSGNDAQVVAPLPETLAETGLYADWDAKVVAPDHLVFSPQYPLWTDGAIKHRWLHLPAGTWIDGTNPDAWVFPVGTKVWKEFRFNGAPAETRLIERTAVDLDCPLNVKYEINDPELNFALVRDGVAFAILPDSAGLELELGTQAMGKRRLVRPPITRMQSIVRVAESSPGSAVLAAEQAVEAVLRTLVTNKVLRGTLVYEKTYIKRR